MTSTHLVLVEEAPPGRFVATVPAFPGCVGRGRTAQVAVQNARRLCAAMARARSPAGDPPRADRTFRVSSLEIMR